MDNDNNFARLTDPFDSSQFTDPSHVLHADHGKPHPIPESVHSLAEVGGGAMTSWVTLAVFVGLIGWAIYCFLP